jgi:hypothetical protein
MLCRCCCVDGEFAKNVQGEEVVAMPALLVVLLLLLLLLLLLRRVLDYGGSEADLGGFGARKEIRLV